MQSQKGFTLIELLVVVAIIGLLASITLASLNTARSKAQIAKAREELHQLSTAVEFLNDDTGLIPGPNPVKQPSGNCSFMGGTDEVYLDLPAAGITSTDGNYPGWKGPYMKVPLDPWGHSYWFDNDYFCSGAPVGCEGVGPLVYTRSIVSSGPNGSPINTYDADDIVKILCIR